jgi:preprotein translocase subunit SecE
MAVEEDVKGQPPAEGESASAEDASRAPQEDAPLEPAPGEGAEGTGGAEQEVHDVAPVGAMSPTQLGTQRFVYAGYFAGAIAIAFLMSKLIDFGWLKLQAYRPTIGEPRDEVVMPLAGLIGASAAVYYWYRTRARQLAEEVATEMSKVTWPTRTEVTNGTVVVIVTTVVSTVFFALMDKFWGFITNLVYGGGT